MDIGKEIKELMDKYKDNPKAQQFIAEKVFNAYIIRLVEGKKEKNND